jgi:hypothetical protein
MPRDFAGGDMVRVQQKGGPAQKGGKSRMLIEKGISRPCLAGITAPLRTLGLA